MHRWKLPLPTPKEGPRAWLWAGGTVTVPGASPGHYLGSCRENMKSGNNSHFLVDCLGFVLIMSYVLHSKTPP